MSIVSFMAPNLRKIYIGAWSLGSWLQDSSIYGCITYNRHTSPNNSSIEKTMSPGLYKRSKINGHLYIIYIYITKITYEFIIVLYIASCISAFTNEKHYTEVKYNGIFEAKHKNMFCTFIIGFLISRLLCAIVYTKDKT